MPALSHNALNTSAAAEMSVASAAIISVTASDARNSRSDKSWA